MCQEVVAITTASYNVAATLLYTSSTTTEALPFRRHPASLPWVYRTAIWGRGVATFSDGLPMREGSVRMLWGAGVRAGLYPLSNTDVYWFTTANAPEVRAAQWQYLKLGFMSGLPAKRQCALAQHCRRTKVRAIAYLTQKAETLQGCWRAASCL